MSTSSSEIAEEVTAWCKYRTVVGQVITASMHLGSVLRDAGDEDTARRVESLTEEILAIPSKIPMCEQEEKIAAIAERVSELIKETENRYKHIKQWKAASLLFASAVHLSVMLVCVFVMPNESRMWFAVGLLIAATGECTVRAVRKSFMWVARKLGAKA